MRGDRMLQELQDKKVIFFDVGYTLDRPASGDWMFTNRFLAEAGDRLKARTGDEISRARDAGLRFLEQNHLVTSVEAECEQFYRYYSIISDELGLGLSEEQRRLIARDRAQNMRNYIPYPGITEVLGTLSKTHKLGIISDTWPSIVQQLDYIGVSKYLSFTTFSCFVGVFKPDRRMYLDALEKSGVRAEETVFIDDSLRNLKHARILQRLVVALGNGKDHDLRVLAQVEIGGTYEVANILEQHEIEVIQVEHFHGPANHIRLQMARTASVNLHGWNALGFDALGVHGTRDVALDDSNVRQTTHGCARPAYRSFSESAASDRFPFSPPVCRLQSNPAASRGRL